MLGLDQMIDQDVGNQIDADSRKDGRQEIQGNRQFRQKYPVIKGRHGDFGHLCKRLQQIHVKRRERDQHRGKAKHRGAGNGFGFKLKSSEEGRDFLAPVYRGYRRGPVPEFDLLDFLDIAQPKNGASALAYQDG